MGIYSQLYGLTGGYAPSGAYSLAVYTRADDGRPGKLLGEHFFVVGPARYSTGYNFKISAKTTYDGASVTDFGEGIHNIQLSGVIGAYHTGPVRTPSVIREKLFGREGTRLSVDDLAKSFFQTIARQTGFTDKPGYFDFFDLIWLLYDSRSPERFTQRKPERLISADPLSSGADSIYRAGAKAGLGSLDSENSVLVFNDYDLSRRYEVVYQNNAFEITQSAEDPFAWQWSLNLNALQDLSGKRPFVRQPLPDIGNVIANAVIALDDLNFALNSGLRQIGEAARHVNEVLNAHEQFSDSLNGFHERRSQEQSLFWQTLIGLKQKNESLAEWLEGYYFPGGSVAENTDLPSAHTDYSTDQTRVETERLKSILAKVQAAMLQAENEQSRPEYIQTPPGVETWEDLALAVLGDVSKAKDLALLNPIGTSPRALKKIQIAENTQRAETGIIAGRAQDAGNIEKNLFGTDLALAADGDFTISPDGDLDILSGLNSLTANLLDRLNHQAGTIPLHPEWGIDLLIGSLPDHIIARAGPAKIVENLYQDPGVRSVELKNLSLQADRLDLAIGIVPQGDTETIELEASLSV